MAKPLLRRATVRSAPRDDPLRVHEITALLEKPEGILSPSYGSPPPSNITPFGPVRVTPDLKSNLDRLNLLLVREFKRHPVVKRVICCCCEPGEVGLKCGGPDGYQTETAECLISQFLRRTP
jgi:hypothetical protein